MILAAPLFIYLGIQSPFLVACFYGAMKRFPKVASPYLVVPAVATVCGWFYFEGIWENGSGLAYSHFIYAGFFLLGTYFLAQRWGYSAVDSLVLAILTEMALDELWQMPYNLTIWPQSLLNFEVGIVTAGWNLMSIPLIAVFLIKFNGSVRFDMPTKALLAASLVLTAYGTVIVGLSMAGGTFNEGYYVGAMPRPLTDWLLLPWFLFFLALFRSSSAGRDKAGLPHNEPDEDAPLSSPPPSQSQPSSAFQDAVGPSGRRRNRLVSWLLDEDRANNRL